MSHTVFTRYRLAILLGLPLLEWVFLIGGGTFGFQPLVKILSFPHPQLSAVLVLWLLATVSLLVDWGRGTLPERRHPSPWLMAGVALLAPLWLLGFLFMLNWGGTAGVIFALCVPAAISTPIALVVLIATAMAGRLWQAPPTPRQES